MSRILWVEDIEQTIKDLLNELRGLGHEIIHFKCASRAVKWLETDRPDVLFLDVRVAWLSMDDPEALLNPTAAPGGFDSHYGGVWIYDYVRNTRQYDDLPVVFITNLEKEDIPDHKTLDDDAHCEFLNKALDKLIVQDVINQAMQASRLI